MSMADTVIWIGIAYTFYDVPYSLSTIKKLDKKISTLQKEIYGLPNCTPNVTTQLLYNLFGMEALSLKNAYFGCIGKQLRNTLTTMVDLQKYTLGSLTIYSLNMVEL